MSGFIALLVAVAFILFYVRRYTQKKDQPFFAKKSEGNPRKYETVSREKELDNLLDKVRKKGMKNLSDAEKLRLKELSELIGS